MKAKILGSAQDGGVPHLGCNCDNCKEARKNHDKVRYATSLKIFEEKGPNYLIDASPDIRFQLSDEYIDGIFISHGHLGHYTGLLHLGKEAQNAELAPVYCTERMKELILNNQHFRYLYDQENIEFHTIEPGKKQEMNKFRITPIEVLHRYVETDMVSFFIETNNTSLYYLTDIDEWSEKAEQKVNEADIALIDGCFYSKDEIGRYSNVPHPTVNESMERFSDADTEIYFTHINHTNPILKENSPERKEVLENGFKIAREGLEIEL